MAGFGIKALEKELSELDVLIDDQIRGSAVWVEKEGGCVTGGHVGRISTQAKSDKCGD